MGAALRAGQPKPPSRTQAHRCPVPPLAFSSPALLLNPITAPPQHPALTAPSAANGTQQPRPCSHRCELRCCFFLPPATVLPAPLSRTQPQTHRENGLRSCARSNAEPRGSSLGATPRPALLLLTELLRSSPRRIAHTGVLPCPAARKAALQPCMRPLQHNKPLAPQPLVRLQEGFSTAGGAQRRNGTPRLRSLLRLPARPKSGDLGHKVTKFGGRPKQTAVLLLPT